MAKSPDAFRTISEVADWLGVEAHVLRFWETKFSQIKPVKRAGGRRYYRPSDMALLGGIRRLLHDEGMTIRGVQKILRERGSSHVSEMSPDLRLASDAPTVAAASPTRVPRRVDAAPPPPPRRPAVEETPTLPFDRPTAQKPAASHETTKAQTLDVSGSDGARARSSDRRQMGRPWQGLQLDQAAAADVLARARALVERLRNTPE